MDLLARPGKRRILPPNQRSARYGRVQDVAAGGADGREQAGSQHGRRDGRGLGGRPWATAAITVTAVTAPAAPRARPACRTCRHCRCRSHARAARSGETCIVAVNCRIPSRASSSMSELMIAPLPSPPPRYPRQRSCHVAGPARVRSPTSPCPPSSPELPPFPPRSAARSSATPAQPAGAAEAAPAPGPPHHEDQPPLPGQPAGRAQTAQRAGARTR